MVVVVAVKVEAFEVVLVFRTIIHNDNKPDTSAIEDTLNKQENSLQRIYDNQMTQHHYSNFIGDGYAHFPQIDARQLQMAGVAAACMR